ncbi:MAG: MetQ/NlpA family ABC transporter substrate-binding protein [Coriobacteriales bacterium]|jgi:D-methionine transport system substrate-binding protein|nr:MetQ/NlpA family ABC transporter substrate-binding protein [Coriobacteriales bacterium]
MKNITIKKLFRTIIASAVSAALLLSLAACGGSPAPAEDTSNNANTADETPTPELRVLKVGASPSPHAEILAFVKDELAKEGIDLQVTEYSDYVIPNTALQDGDIDANFFQHLPYLEEFNTENKTTLASVAAIHFEPLGIYAGKTASLDTLQDGALIAVPNDTTNEARALLLLQEQGLITLPANADLTITPLDITDNPKNLEFIEVEAAALPRQLGEVDLAVINGNYALSASLPASSILAAEDPASLAATTYANIIAVKVGNESNPDILALVKALKSDAVREFITEEYQGVVIPVF